MSTTQTPIYQAETGEIPENVKVEKILLEWSAPSRPYKVRTREFYTTILSIAFLLGVILLLLKEFLLIGVIMAFAFLSYVLATYKPEDAKHQITTSGIRTDGKLWTWDQFTNFWLKKQWDQEVVICKTITALPGVILLVIDPSKRENILKTIGDKIPLVKPTDSFVDKASKWLGNKIPLENS
ncbi:hypothetical protein KBD75_00295 [Candidatus Woesebacteria bacterium]|nr:hypothetical protein [Candidatus Woesebacteria bacterium]